MCIRDSVVEGELGRLAGVEDEIKVSAEDSSYTRPEEVYEFASKTGVDSLAIAIGTSHGAFKFKGEPKLRFDILEKVTEILPGFPIVLHGASSVIPEFVEMINKYGGDMPGAQGVPEELLRKAAESAVCKINIDSDPVSYTHLTRYPASRSKATALSAFLIKVLFKYNTPSKSNTKTFFSFISEISSFRIIIFNNSPHPCLQLRRYVASA